MIYDDEITNEAESLFNQCTDENDVQMQNVARMKSVKVTKDVIGDVEYTTYEMPDFSKLTFGNNGYLGCSSD